MRRFLPVAAIVFLFAITLVVVSASAGMDCCGKIDRADIGETLQILAHPALGGRGTGEAGFDVAGIFLARELRNAGFLPLPGSREGYFQSFAFPPGSKTPEQSRNVVGYLPGKVYGEYVVIGAHYDHLGIVGGKTYLGADDNASGTAGVVEIARALGALAKSGKKFRRGIIVAFWGAEERGLIGSRHFVASGIVPITQVVAVLNLDMIGRNDPRRLFVIGAEVSREFPERSPMLARFLHEENARLDPPFTLDFSQEGYFFRTDSGSFFRASPRDQRVPVLFFFGGDHADYHQPTDTAEKINTAKLRNVACLARRIAVRTAESKERPRYIERAR